MRRTKIVATLGPATDRAGEMQKLVEAGVDVVRLNFSHGTHAEHRARVELVRKAADLAGRDVGILMDLQGPKIRLESFRDGPIELKEGAPFTLDTSLAPDAGTSACVGVTYKKLNQDVHPEDVLLLADGDISLVVTRVDGPRIHCRVETGGTLSDHKGINRKGGGLTADALTEKDRRDIQLAAALQADYLAVSFPRHASDIERARRLLRKAGGNAFIVAKIERSEAVENLESIILASDAVMIARGDLAVEIGDAQLPGVQKRIVHAARSRNTVVITATQMMESMVTHPTPTRAEVLDVANAVLDGTDAVMLSEETAVGQHPVKVVNAMARVCEGAEREPISQRSRHRIDDMFKRTDEAIAMASMYVANHLNVRALVALTESGTTPLLMSRIRSGIPIYALTRHETTRRRVTLYRGVYPVAFDGKHSKSADLLYDVVQALVSKNAVSETDLIIVTKGAIEGLSGGTNSLQLIRVGDVLR